MRWSCEENNTQDNWLSFRHNSYNFMHRSEYLMSNRILGLPIGTFIAASIRQLTDKITNKL